MARVSADGHAPEIRHSAYPHTPAVQQCGEDRYHNDADDHWHVIFHSACSGWGALRSSPDDAVWWRFVGGMTASL